MSEIITADEVRANRDKLFEDVEKVKIDLCNQFVKEITEYSPSAEIFIDVDNTCIYNPNSDLDKLVPRSIVESAIDHMVAAGYHTWFKIEQYENETKIYVVLSIYNRSRKPTREELIAEYKDENYDALIYDYFQKDWHLDTIVLGLNFLVSGIGVCGALFSAITIFFYLKRFYNFIADYRRMFGKNKLAKMSDYQLIAGIFNA
jgi:hypothetical protein